jgi:hypothetical protein
MVSDTVERISYDVALRFTGNYYDSTLLSIVATMAPPLQDRGPILSFCVTLRDKLLDFCRLKPGIAELLRTFCVEIGNEIYLSPRRSPTISEWSLNISGQWPWREGYNMSIFEIMCMMLMTKSCYRVVVMRNLSCFSLSARLGRFCRSRAGNTDCARVLAIMAQAIGSKECALGLVSLSDPLQSISQIHELPAPECFIPLTIIGKMPMKSDSQTAVAREAFEKLLGNIDSFLNE